MKNVPEKIYLNFGVDKDEIDLKDEDFEKLVEISWSDTRINDKDLEYTLSERQTSTEVSEHHNIKSLHIDDVVRNVCSHEKTSIINSEGNTIGRYCSTCDVFYNIENVGLKC